MDDESGSDWDSLAGDVEPESVPQVTPRSPSLSPPQSPAKPIPQQRPVNNKNIKEDTTERLSTPNSISSVKKDEGIEMSPRTFYGKPGVTSFVDRGGSDDETSTWSNKATKKAEKKMSDTRQRTAPRPEPPAADQNVPFTLFQASGTAKEKAQPQPKPQRQKLKQSYVKAPTPEPQAMQLSAGVPDKYDSSDDDRTVSKHYQPHPPVTPGLVNIGYEGSTQGLQQSQSPEPMKQNPSYQRSSIHAPDWCVPIGPGTMIERNSYYFDKAWHQTHTFVTKDDKPDALMPILADRSEMWVRRIWQEFFGGLRVLVDFVLIFFLEFFEFVIHWIVLRLVMGILSVMGDHVVKPILTTLFNGFIQPSFIFMWNIFSGLRNMAQPMLDISREFTLQIATILRAFRLVEMNWKPEFGNGRRRNQQVSEL